MGTNGDATWLRVAYQNSCLSNTAGSLVIHGFGDSCAIIAAFS